MINYQVNQLQTNYPLQTQINKSVDKTPKIAFGQILTEAKQLKISKHAEQRLIERDIHINEQQWSKIAAKMTEAKAKGITDSLVITNDAALLVSTKNHTVVTAMDRIEAESKIFTNINGTILMSE